MKYEMYYPKFIKEPIIKKFNFNDVIKECFFVKLDDYDIEKCKKYRTIISKKPGIYGRGLLNEKESNVAETTGKLGEVAFGKIFNLPIDFSYSTNGDFGDFELINKKIDIKTARMNYGRTLILARNEFGYDISMKSDIYVGAYLYGEYSSVVIVGWHARKYLYNKPIVPAVRGKHYNREMFYRETQPMKELLEKHRNFINNY